MDLLLQLWPAVLASTVAVWIASALSWMVIGHHGGDFKALPDESKTLAAVRGLGLKPGSYMFPSMTKGSKADKAEMEAKWAKGPVGIVRVFTPVNMGRNMLLSVLFYLFISLVVAYLGSVTLKAGDGFSRVFQVLGTAGVLGYAFAFIPNDIWFQNSKRATIMCVLDGLAYGLITGAVFAALWPK
jgi:hypothetical protein